MIERLPRTDLTYSGAHGRVKWYWGSATQYPCVQCGEAANEWAYDGTDPTEIYGSVAVNGVDYPVRYSVWPEFYEPLCYGCHRAMDKSSWAARRETCKHGHEMTPENTYTRPSRPGTRECRTCRAEVSKGRYAAKKAKEPE